eukprot:gnl/MRDRNA2_/MRDRNA2_293605_c0_seq1.p1 gnl/MRDRNA2_/MRDRNA2_293605_c0~~gnl/MRDRNA2_/MRDRNA2_293605_c0_seq1.p1  ORF type:complete len:210 (-),score=41.19 gnl/MRDRNA2_/MRDRNA2_293605_c0_seq1:14-604(-)
MPAVNPFQQLKLAIAGTKAQQGLNLGAPEFVPQCTEVNHDVLVPPISPQLADQTCFAPSSEDIQIASNVMEPAQMESWEGVLTTLPPPISSLGPLFDETMQHLQCPIECQTLANSQPAAQAPAMEGPAELLVRRMTREQLLACRPMPDSSEQQGLRTVSLSLLSSGNKKYNGSAPPGLDSSSPNATRQPKLINQWQ